MTTNLKEIEKKAGELGSIDAVKIELKRIQSVKCRLLKQKSRADYDQLMTECVKTEQLLKEVRSYFEPKEKPVTMFEKSDIENLDFDETIKAIKSIQSKKCLSQFGLEAEYKKACEIESMLLEHKKSIKPIEQTVVRKTDIENLINHFENQDVKISRDYVIEMLSKLL